MEKVENYLKLNDKHLEEGDFHWKRSLGILETGHWPKLSLS